MAPGDPTLSRRRALAQRQRDVGTAIKRATTRLGIKPCAPCNRRAAALDRAVPNFWPEQGLPNYMADAARRWKKKRRQKR